VGSLRFRQVKIISEDYLVVGSCCYLYILGSEFESLFLLLLFGLWFQILLRPFFFLPFFDESVGE